MRALHADIAIAIDYFQILAIFALSKVQWPAAIQELFHVLSAFNLNIEIVAPECLIPKLSYLWKWLFIMAVPLFLQALFALVILANAAYASVVMGRKTSLAGLGGSVVASVLVRGARRRRSRARTVRAPRAPRRRAAPAAELCATPRLTLAAPPFRRPTPRPPFSDDHVHHVHLPHAQHPGRLQLRAECVERAACRAGARAPRAPPSCAPFPPPARADPRCPPARPRPPSPAPPRAADPPDGKSYMTAVFEECGKPGGIQMTLLPLAVLAVVIYILGYPAGVARLLYTYRELTMEDQLLRAKGVGDDKLTNPNAFAFRERWGRLYYQFRPDLTLWILVIILRKFCIAATFILFNRQASFQLAAAFLVLFLSYSAQMRFAPYMTPAEFDKTLREHEAQSFTDPIHARLRSTIGGIASRTRKAARKNVLGGPGGAVDAGALLGVLKGWLFNYNTVEQLLLFSAGIVCVMGLMFAAQAANPAYYRDSRDATTAVVIGVVAASIVYLVTVFFTEVTIIMGESNRRKAILRNRKSGEGDEGAGASPDKGGKGGKGARASGEAFDAGDVTSAVNPMMMGGASSRSAGGGDGGGDGPASPVGGNDSDLAEALAAMRDPPTSLELWELYRAKFEELAASVDTLKAQVAAAPAALRAGGALDADGADADGAAATA